MSDASLPIVVLGGGDSQRVELPSDGRDQHALSGIKGADLRIGGRMLVDLLVERLRASGRFDPIHIAGPAAAYRDLDERIERIDTHGSFGENLRAAMEQVRSRHPGRCIAFTTCDILPEVEELRALIGRFHDERPCDVWYPLVRVPAERERLGASKWKPVYRVVVDHGNQAVTVLPGHLMIVDPAALRLKLLYKTFELGYRTRNRSISRRRSVMLAGTLGQLLYQDLLHLLSLRAPSLTWTALRVAFFAAQELKAGTIPLRRLEEVARRTLVRHRHRRRYPSRRIRLPIVDLLWLALDIDTEEEARERGAELSGETDAV